MTNTCYILAFLGILRTLENSAIELHSGKQYLEPGFTNHQHKETRGTTGSWVGALIRQ